MKCSKLLSCSFAFGPILATSAASESTRGQDQEAGGPDARKTSWTSGDRSLSTLPRLQATLSSQLSHELRTFTVHYASEISSLRLPFLFCPSLPCPSLACSLPCFLPLCLLLLPWFLLCYTRIDYIINPRFKRHLWAAL